MTTGRMRSFIAAAIADEQTQRIVAASRKTTAQPTAAFTGLRFAVVGSATWANHSAINPESCSWYRPIAPHAGAFRGVALLARVRAVVGNVRSNGSPAATAPHNELSFVTGAAVLIATLDALDLGDEPPAPIAEASPSMISAHESSQPVASGDVHSASASSSVGVGEASPGLGLRRRRGHARGALLGGVLSAREESRVGSFPR